MRGSERETKTKSETEIAPHPSPPSPETKAVNTATRASENFVTVPTTGPTSTTTRTEKGRAMMNRTVMRWRRSDIMTSIEVGITDNLWCRNYDEVSGSEPGVHACVAYGHYPRGGLKGHTPGLESH